MTKKITLITMGFSNHNSIEIALYFQILRKQIHEIEKLDVIMLFPFYYFKWDYNLQLILVILLHFKNTSNLIYTLIILSFNASNDKWEYYLLLILLIILHFKNTSNLTCTYLNNIGQIGLRIGYSIQQHYEPKCSLLG